MSNEIQPQQFGKHPGHGKDGKFLPGNRGNPTTDRTHARQMQKFRHALFEEVTDDDVRALARTLGPKKIRINCVLPGFVKTERQVERWLTPELERFLLEGQCLKRFIEPEEVARLVVFLASEDGSACTNQLFVIDAGWT